MYSGAKMLNNKAHELLDSQLSEILFLSSVFSPDNSSSSTPPIQRPSSLPPSGQTCEPGSADAAVASGKGSWGLPLGAGQTSDPPGASSPCLASREQALKEEEELLLAKINQLTGDESPRPRSMKRLVPDLFDDTQPLVSSAPPPGDKCENPLTTATEPPANHTGRFPVVEVKV